MTEIDSPSPFDARSVIHHYERLRNFIRASVSSDEEASDLAQESYLRLIRYGGTHKVRDGERLLYRIARNLLADGFRRRAARPEEVVEPERIARESAPVSDLQPRRVAEARERIHLVEEAILAMPERCREVFLLNRFGGLSYSRIAERLSISQSTVEKHMARAILACRRAVEDEPRR